VDETTFEAGRAVVATPAGPLSYVAVGTGQAAVFVHGVGTNAYLWRNLIGHLAGERRCIALDLPLHGRSPASADQDFTLGGLADTVIAFVDALGLARFDLVAHDTGGAVAQIVAARVPHRLRSFTLTNCETHDNVPPDGFKPTVELARSGALVASAPMLLADLVAARGAVFAMGYEDPEHLSIETVRAFLEPVLGTPTAARQFARLLTSLSPRDLLAVEDELATLTVPTLVVWGTGDEMFDVSWAHWLHNLIPGVTRVVELADARLFFPDERADQLAALLRQHWSETDTIEQTRDTGTSTTRGGRAR